MPTADDLLRVPLFADLSAADRETLASRFEPEEFGAGRRIMEQGDSGYSFFVVVEGRAAVTRDDRQIGYLEPGDYFGEMAIVGDDGRRTATVTALSPLVAWVMFGVSFRTLQIDHPHVATAVERAVAERRSLY